MRPPGSRSTGWMLGGSSIPGFQGHGLNGVAASLEGGGSHCILGNFFRLGSLDLRVI
jgi:hypothetical protein